MSETTRGWGPWGQEWYSICSKHMMHRHADCGLCQKGRWVNVWATTCSSVVYRLAPKLWIWWANRPNNPTRRWLTGGR